MGDTIAATTFTITSFILALVSIAGTIMSMCVSVLRNNRETIDRIDKAIFDLIDRFTKENQNIKETLYYFDHNLNLGSHEFLEDHLFLQLLTRRKILLDIFSLPEPPKTYNDTEVYMDMEHFSQYTDCEPMPKDSDKRFADLLTKHNARFFFQHYRLKSHFDIISNLSPDKRTAAVHHILLNNHANIRHSYQSYKRLRESIDLGYGKYRNDKRKNLMNTILNQSMTPHQEMLFSHFVSIRPSYPQSNS